MTEWRDIDYAREIHIGLDSLNWPEGTPPDLIEHLTASLDGKRVREVVVNQMYDEWRGFRGAGYSLRDNNVILATSSYYAFFINYMEQTMEAAASQRYRQHLVEGKNRTAQRLKDKFGFTDPRSYTLETLEVTVPLLNEDPTGFSAAEFLERRCQEDFGEHTPPDFGVKKAVARYKELYEALVKAGATLDIV